MKTTPIAEEVVQHHVSTLEGVTYIILLEVLLKPGSPYSFGGTPKARQPLMSCPSDSSVITRGT